MEALQESRYTGSVNFTLLNKRQNNSQEASVKNYIFEIIFNASFKRNQIFGPVNTQHMYDTKIYSSPVRANRLFNYEAFRESRNPAGILLIFQTVLSSQGVSLSSISGLKFSTFENDTPEFL